MLRATVSVSGGAARAAAVVLALLAVAGPAAPTESEAAANFNLDPSTVTRRVCVTKPRRLGECVKYSACYANFTLNKYGVIDPEEFRAGDCFGQLDFCCETENVIGCGLTTGDAATWSVALYRDGGNPRTRSPDGLYCAGTLLGRHSVLTAAACALPVGVAEQRVWASLASPPAAGAGAGAAKAVAVNVRSALKHPLYNSGSRAFDVALLELEGDLLDRLDGINASMCLPAAGAEPVPPADCSAPGWGPRAGTYAKRITHTPVAVSAGRCGAGAAGGDEAAAKDDDADGPLCVRPKSNDTWISDGSPVLCVAAGRAWLAGVVSAPSGGAAGRGAWSAQSSWVRDEVAKMEAKDASV